MARIIRHRKLFPALTQANQTQDCPNSCDPYTTFLYFSPPPPTSPPPTSYSSADAAADAATTTTYQTVQIPPYVIILASLLAGLSLFGCYYFVVACRHGSFFHRFRNQPPHPSGDGEGGSGGDREEEEDDQRDLLDLRRDTPEVAVDHPIWYIATVGLQQAVINSITVCKYRAGEGLIEGTECSVCLAEFLDGETLRLLPKCSHAFHIPCIDRWLRSHTNCPLCRSPIVADAALPSAAPQPAGHQSLASTNRSSYDSGPTGEMRVGSFGRNVGESVRISGVDGEAAAGVGDVRIDSKQIVGLDLDSACRVGRSFSMDYTRYLRLNFNGFGGSSSDDHTVGLEKSATSSLGQPPPPLPETAASGKRSLSCGDAAELFPRKTGTQYQSSSAIVLPL